MLFLAKIKTHNKKKQHIYRKKTRILIKNTKICYAYVNITTCNEMTDLIVCVFIQKNLSFW